MVRCAAVLAVFVILLADTSTGKFHTLGQELLGENVRDVPTAFQKEYYNAFLSVDIPKQREIIGKLRAFMERNESARIVLSRNEISFLLEDLDRAISGSNEIQNRAKLQQQQVVEGTRQELLGNLPKALQHYRDSLTQATLLYGEDSFHAIAVRINIADAYYESGRNLDDAIAIYKNVQAVLETKGLTSSDLYCQTITGLFGCYHEKGDKSQAITLGRLVFKTHQQRRATDSNQFFNVAAVFIRELNTAKRHQEALQLAKQILDGPHPMTGLEAFYSLNIYQDYAVAQMRLGNGQGVSTAFDQALLLANQLPNYPDDSKLILLKQYQEFAENSHDKELSKILSSKIAEIERRHAQPRSRYTSSN